MSLLRWGQEDDNKDQQDPFGLSPIKTVQSVQSAWQPTQDNAATPQSDSSMPQDNNYLLSEQKAQIDTQIQQRRDAEAAAAAAAAAEAERVARETEAARNAQQQQPKPKTKYTNPNNKKDEGFWGFVKDMGSGIQQGAVNFGDVAGQAGATLNYINPFNTKTEQQKNADLLAYDASRRKFLDENKDFSGNSFTGTRDVEGAVTRINNGSANLQDYMALAGKGLQTGIDATGLLNPARAATTGLPSVARYVLRDMGFFGGLQGVATTANTYGQTGDLGKSLEAGAKDALIGGVLQGSLDVAGHGVHHVANRTLNSLRRPEKAIENAIDEAGAGAQNAERTKALNENGLPEDGNVSFQDKQQPVDGNQSQLETSIRNEQLFPAGDTMVNTTPVADGVVMTPVEKQPSQMDNLTPVQTPETAQAAQVTPVAEGTVQAPSEVVPTNSPNTPVIKSEQIRQLQDKKAGASQAEDAAINQRLQELQNIPRGDRTEAQSSELNNIILDGFSKVRKQLGSDEDFYNNFLLQEANKPTRSADLALEIIGKVENDGMSVEDALNDSLLRDAPKTSIETAHDSYDSLSGMIRELEKSSNQPGLWKAVQGQMKGMNLEERVQYLNGAWKKMRDEGTLAKDFVNKENGYTPETQPSQKTIPEGGVTPATSENSPQLDSGNLPPGMGDGGNGPNPESGKPKKEVTPEQQQTNDFAKRVFSNTDLHKDMKNRLAKALGLEKEGESTIDSILADSNLSEKDKKVIQEKFNKLDKAANDYNDIMKSQRKGFVQDGINGLDEESAKQANKLIDTYGRIERDLNGHIRQIQGRKSIGNRVANVAENLTGARNANLLTSVGGIERNLTQELGANIIDGLMHPVKYVKNSPRMATETFRAAKRAAREFTVAPKTVSEAFPWAIGNVYRTLMSPVTGIANVRKGIARETLAESLLRAEGYNPSRSEIKKFAGSMGADSEVVANNLMGILNGMTSHTKGIEVMKAYQEFIHTGSAAAKERFLANTEHASNIAAKLTQVASKADAKPQERIAIALTNVVMPFVNTATNLAKTSGTYWANPMARAVNDEVLAAVRKNPENILTTLKALGVKGGVMAGVYGLYASGVISYNNGDEVDKPKGISIDRGDGKYFPVRGTPIELPIAGIVLAGEIAKDVADNNVRPLNYYGEIIGGSLPYIDSTNNIIAATASGVNSYLNGNGTNDTGDNGYALKSYGVNMAKSFVPLSNNGVIPAVNGWQGKSTNAKSTYDKDIPTWFGNQMKNSYPFLDRNSLPDSRDAAGRVRTVDQQGGFTINKTMNDKNTIKYNDTIDSMVKYARNAGIGDGTDKMFNSFDTGKNNNFKSIQDTISFLDAPEVNGKKMPDNSKKLEPNAKLSGLSQQIYNGFFGNSGSELLSLDGKNLYSDVSVPGKYGGKNTRLPISMESIKNAIAQTDLPEDQRNRLYEIGQQKDGLYERRKAGEITYDQEQAMRAEIAQQEQSLLQNSKSYQKLMGLMTELDNNGFFSEGGMGSTRSGQTYLWNSLNSLLGSKGATPATNYPDTSKSGYGNGGGKGKRASEKPGDRGDLGVKWTPVKARAMDNVSLRKYTPVKVSVKLGNEVRRNKTQNYSDRSF